MIENKNEASRNLEKALQALEQAKHGLEQAKAMLELAKQEVQSIQYAKIRNVAVSVKNEVLEMIAKVRERKGRLGLPIVSGKYLRRISDRALVQGRRHKRYSGDISLLHRLCCRPLIVYRQNRIHLTTAVCQSVHPGCWHAWTDDSAIIVLMSNSGYAWDPI